MNIEDNLWYQNGYKIGDILIGRRLKPPYIISYVIDDFHSTNRNYIFIKNGGMHLIDNIWMQRHFRFKAQDYISNLDNPTETELSLIQLQFPEIDINMMLEQIKELRS